MQDLLPLFDAPVPATTKKRCVFNDAQIAEKFEECWQSRPKREGSNPKSPVHKKFVSEVKSGENPDLIIAGVRQLRDYYEPELKKRIVPMMQTIFNQRRWHPDSNDGMLTVTGSTSSPSGGSSSFIDIARELYDHAAGCNDPEHGGGHDLD